MDRPKTQEAYIELVNQAMIDAEELRSAIKYDEEYTGGAMGVAETLENNLKSLYAIADRWLIPARGRGSGFYRNRQYCTGCLGPFKPLLRLINQTHRQGLESE